MVVAIVAFEMELNCDSYGEVEETVDLLVARCTINKFQEKMFAVYVVCELFLKWFVDIKLTTIFE